MIKIFIDIFGDKNEKKNNFKKKILTSFINQILIKIFINIFDDKNKKNQKKFLTSFINQVLIKIIRIIISYKNLFFIFNF